MERIESYDDVRDLAEDVYKLIRQVGNAVGYNNLVIEIDLNQMEVIITDEDQDSNL